jgi:ATP-dependent DNA ligase
VPATPAGSIREDQRPQEPKKCPFVNLPEASEGPPKVRMDFAEWTSADKLRHTKFIDLREDKDPRKVVRET